MKRLLIAGAALVIASSAALAHGAATWIMVNPKTAHCCGPDDCHMDTANDIVERDGGWYVLSSKQFIKYGSPYVYASTDSNYWTCRQPRKMEQGLRVKCLFVPVQG